VGAGGTLPQRPRCALALVDLDSDWVTGYFRETIIGRIRRGRHKMDVLGVCLATIRLREGASDWEAGATAPDTQVAQVAQAAPVPQP